jgi:hypothetical protein
MNPAAAALARLNLELTGRGLQLVDFLGDAWGYRAEAGGKVVWCEVAIPA